MKHKTYLLVLFIFLINILPYISADYVFAENNSKIIWCEPSVAQFNDIQREELGIIQTSYDASECSCWEGDITYESEWTNSYCFDNEFGEMLQTHQIRKKVKPWCNQVIQLEETRIVDEEYCKKCSKPKIISKAQSLGCVGQFEIFKTHIVAEMFDEKVDECITKNMVLVEHKETKKCSNIISNVSASPFTGGLGIGILVLLVILGVLYLFRKK